MALKYIIAVLAGALLVAAGIYFWQRSSGEPGEVELSDAYFPVAELGLEFRRPEEIEKLEYFVREFSDPAPAATVAYFSSRDLAAKAGQAGDSSGADQYCSAEAGPIGAVVRVADYPDDGRGLPENALMLGDFYAYLIGPQSACSSNEEVIALQSRQIAQMQQAFSSARTLGGQDGQSVRQGIIEGGISYPSEIVPPEMKVCAENQQAGKTYCINSLIPAQDLSEGLKYRLVVPEGRYFVYASLAENPRDPSQYRAYYNEFVKCGMEIACTDRTPIAVEVADRQVVEGIDPADWYNQR